MTNNNEDLYWFFGCESMDCKKLQLIPEKVEIKQEIKNKDLGEQHFYFDVKWFLLENIFREIIFPENVFYQKHFMVFTVRMKNQFFLIFFIY
jgi:hypothetical protein